MGKRLKPVRKALYFDQIIDPDGEFMGKNGEPSRNIIRHEDGTPNLYGSCYLCGRSNGEASYYYSVTHADEWEADEVYQGENEIENHAVHFLLMEEGFITFHNHVEVAVKPMRLKFMAGTRTAVFLICPECQLLLNVPMDQEAPTKEDDTNTHIVMTGRSFKEIKNSRAVGCYLCGRHESEDSLSLIEHSEGTQIWKETEVATLHLQKIERPFGGSTAIFFLCPECAIVLGMSPRVIITDDGNLPGPNGEFGDNNPLDFFSAMSKFTDPSKIGEDMTELEFVNGASRLIASMGAQEYLSALLETIRGRANDNRKKRD